MDSTEQESMIRDQAQRAGLRKGLCCLSAVAIAVALAVNGCKPSKTANDAAQTVKRYAGEVTGMAEGLSQKTGVAVGLLKKKPEDYIRHAWGPGEQPLPLVGHYTRAQKREYGLMLMAKLAGLYPPYQHRSMEEYLTLVAASVAAFSDRPEEPCAVMVLRSEKIEAYGLPGGYLLVTLGALRTCESESEFAGLMSSCLAHTYLNHDLARMESFYGKLNGNAPVQSLEKASAADLEVIIDHEIEQLIKEGFELEKVEAADRKATDWLVRVGYEPGGLKAFLARWKFRLGEQGAAGPLDPKRFQARNQAMAGRLAEIHAQDATGRVLADRFKRRCQTRMPVVLTR